VTFAMLRRLINCRIIIIIIINYSDSDVRCVCAELLELWSEGVRDM